MDCPKCQAHMELGFIADATYIAVLMQVWYSGKYNPSWWGGLRLRKRKTYYVQTMRCTACGFLEQYAK